MSEDYLNLVRQVARLPGYPAVRLMWLYADLHGDGDSARRVAAYGVGGVVRDMYALGGSAIDYEAVRDWLQERIGVLIDRQGAALLHLTDGDVDLGEVWRWQRELAALHRVLSGLERGRRCMERARLFAVGRYVRKSAWRVDRELCTEAALGYLSLSLAWSGGKMTRAEQNAWWVEARYCRDDTLRAAARYWCWEDITDALDLLETRKLGHLEGCEGVRESEFLIGQERELLSGLLNRWRAVVGSDVQGGSCE